MTQNSYDIRFVAYYSTAGNNVGAQSRVSTTISNGSPLWRIPKRIEFRDGFVEASIATGEMDFISDNRKASGECAGWVEIRDRADQHVTQQEAIEMIQTYTAGANNVVVMRTRPSSTMVVA